VNRQSALNLGTSEYKILRDYAEGRIAIDTTVHQVDRSAREGVKNPLIPEQIGYYRSRNPSKLLTADKDLNEALLQRGPVPLFLEAGPRESLSFDPTSVRAAIITAGGIAPGLNSVIHAIVHRHRDIYKMNEKYGALFGIRNGFTGITCDDADYINLEKRKTDGWVTLGGTKLGSIRGDKGLHSDENADKAAKCLNKLRVDIVYVIGGDGSMIMAHKLYQRLPNVSITCIPKTMDNDILWVWESFGFTTAVEEATHFINTLHTEAESTQRICLVELFGAESGLVAANAAMASGQVDLVLIPEVFRDLIEGSKKDNPKYQPDAYSQYFVDCIDHIHKKMNEREKEKGEGPHAIVVVAEGVSKIFEEMNKEKKKHKKKKFQIQGYITKPGDKIKDPRIIDQLKVCMQDACWNEISKSGEVFINEPRHNIRAVPANAVDQGFCERLGILAVDCALAGYTDFMVSQWLTEYVMVPLELVIKGQKSIFLEDIFWKQIMNMTEQPSHERYKLPKA
jgi:6-phosphofructokinase 1